MPVTSWSYSAYALHAECALKYKLEKIDKIKTPTPPAFIKGRKVHSEIENYIKEPTKNPFPTSAVKSRYIIEPLSQHPSKIVEQKWGFDQRWGATTWGAAWLRSILDAAAIYPDNSVEVIDWKTGKMYATNEDQVELFALTAMVRYPMAPTVTTRLAYVDSGDEVLNEYSAKDREKLKAKWNDKVVPMFNDTIFAPRPNDRCKFCAFARSADSTNNPGAGKCRFG